MLFSIFENAKVYGLIPLECLWLTLRAIVENTEMPKHYCRGVLPCRGRWLIYKVLPGGRSGLFDPGRHSYQPGKPVSVPTTDTCSIEMRGELRPVTNSR